MLLSDIFSIPFLICLAICILLIGCSSIYFYQRILQQDHKITSMVSLISSLTEEDSSKPTASGAVGGAVVSGVSSGGNITIDIKPDHNHRIQVSDDESDSESDCSSSDSEYSTTSSENNCEILSEIEELNDILELDDNDGDNLGAVIIESLIGEPEEEPELEEAITEDSIDTTKSIHLEQPTDFSIFRSINVIDIVSSEPDDATNYKKMSLSKLRETAQSQGHGDTSKLKKQELLKLLGAE